ncbi:MAG: M20 family metallopeptidase [Desulfobacterales bacterium]|jgi:succinyl-diaminopimelate desuccinylase
MDAVALTQKLVQFETINPPGREAACARFLEELLREAGFHVRGHAFDAERTSLVVRGPGATDRPPIVMSGHLDTVPLGEASWTRDPLGGIISGDRLFGRGSSDMKSGVAAMVAAACIVGPHPDLCLVLTAGEENGCQGAQYLVDQGLLPAPIGALVVGEPTSNIPLVGHKGVLWLEIEVTGQTAHGSAPELGDNAVIKAARLIENLEGLKLENQPHPVLGAFSLNVGTIRGGQNINSVPDRAVIGLDIRTVPGMTHAEIVAAVARCGEDTMRITVLTDMAGVATDPSHVWIREVFRVVAARTGIPPAPQGAAYFTDAAALHAVGPPPPTVILGPGEPDQAHQTDEYVRLPRIHEAVAIYTDLIRSWCKR